MATATKKNIKDTLLTLNKKSLNVVEDLIEGSINTGERWQKLYAKTIKKAQPVITEQIDVTFKTAEGVIEQYESAVGRIKELFDEKNTKKSAQKTSTKTNTSSSKTSAKKAPAVAKSLHTDLTVINGIGPKLAEALHQIGITSLEELAAQKATIVSEEITAINSRYAMHDPSEWIAEAKKIVKK